MGNIKRNDASWLLDTALTSADFANPYSSVNEVNGKFRVRRNAGDTLLYFEYMGKVFAVLDYSRTSRRNLFLFLLKRLEGFDSSSLECPKNYWRVRVHDRHKLVNRYPS